MLIKTYKEKYHKNNYQYILIDSTGRVIETDNIIFSVTPDDRLQDTHAFFEILSDILSIKNECFEFSCINLNIESKTIISDITIHTKKNENLVIIENLTRHYNNYQLTAQSRNESIINTQILELKNKYLLEKEIFKNNFIANFSHQLRNPITASIIFSNLLNNSNLDTEQKNYLDIIISANKDLKNRIEDTLDISKIQSGKLILIEKVFSLNKLLNDITIGYTSISSKKHLDFKVDIDNNLPEFIKGDEYRLKQVIGNLLNNAVAFTNTGEIKLEVSLNYTRANKANIRIEVSDTGIGIAPENLEDIFERFTKVESQIKNNNSIGLGLAIVKYLISEMDGNIKIESELNKGSKFICFLKFKISDYKEHSLKKELLQRQKPNLKKKQNILLLEDSELMQLTILKILASSGDFYLNIISKGEELVPNILNQNVDLILLSNTIEDFAANELINSVRNLSKEHKKIPIIVMSSQAYKEDIKRFKSSGANHVLTKPFDEETLVNTLYKYKKNNE